MKPRLLICAATLMLLGFGCASKKWQPGSGEGFTVSMPGVPIKGQQTTSTPAGQITNYTYVVEFKNEAFTVFYIDYPPSALEKMTDTEKFLDGGRNGDIASFNGTLTAEHP